ncbi:hypothetical protein GBA65_22030 (plasmid) [Rubrobacter marinus]|uniref:Uncharacterized protein n=2 Tax=Rubrobacter marinus TaxID=2653852 RepID=A0A6G8Q4D2_9ACTN|nr:hypothetical protein GBA65_22030 [Rubrobacter marinus]
MPEAEVAARFAFWLLGHPEGGREVEVAVDGAGVEVRGRTIFELRRFLKLHGWEMDPAGPPDRWRGTYRNAEHPDSSLRVHSRPGVGDVVGTVGEKRVRAECKKGPLARSRSGSEIKLLREALAQLLTVGEVGEEDVLVAAVPDTPTFRRHASAWRDAPLMRRVGLRVALVGRDDGVNGLDL